jgi:hypothetical protein
VAKCAWSAGHVHYSNPLRWRSGTCLFQRTTEREIVVNLATAVFLRSMSEISEVRSLYPPCHPCRPLSSPACRSRRYDSDQQIHRRRFPSVARLLLSLAKLNALQGDQPAPALSKVQITDKKHMKKTLSKQASKGFQGWMSSLVTQEKVFGVFPSTLKASFFPLKWTNESSSYGSYELNYIYIINHFLPKAGLVQVHVNVGVSVSMAVQPVNLWKTSENGKSQHCLKVQSFNLWSWLQSVEYDPKSQKSWRCSQNLECRPNLQNWYTLGRDMWWIPQLADFDTLNPGSFSGLDQEH